MLLLLPMFSRMGWMGSVTGRRRGFSLLAVLLAGVLAVSLPALADPKTKLEKIEAKKERIRQQRAQNAERGKVLVGKIGRLDAKRARVDSRVDELDSRIRSLDGKIVEAKDDLEREQQKLAILTRDLQGVLEDLNERTDAFTARAVAAYMAGPTAAMDSLLTSQSFNDLVNRYTYYESALNADAQMLEDIEVLRDSTEVRRNQILVKEHEITVTKRNLESDRLALADARHESAIILADREEVLAEKETLLAKIESNEDRLRAAENQLDQDSDALEAIILAARQQEAEEASHTAPTGGGVPTVPSRGGQLLWPASGPVTSPYGYRTHPIFGDQRLHTGIDIGAAYGSTVIAADSGTVTYAGAMSGYGNVLVVDHGGGMSTTYNHLSAFTVGVGQSVGRGTAIAAVGCTGYCTGPHLHFEVRIDGVPVDPMPYLQ
jgi:murein DD-endopeptidase MepM/ murein hydrolase activator NlpD